MKIVLLGLVLALGCTGDHVVGSTTEAPDAAMSDGNGSKDANNPDASTTDGGACGGRREPCCTTGMPCQPGFSCTNGICR